MFRVFLPLGTALAGVCLLVGSLGCEPTKPIRSYTVPKPDAVYESNHVDPGAPEDAEGNPLPLDDRMLAAFIPHGNTAWFVKISGPKAAVASQADAFQAFVKSIEFPADAKAEPTWDAPANWKKTDGPAPRFATLKIDDIQPPLEVTVSSLPLSAGDLSAYVLQNVNRWRGQMSLRPITQQRLAKESQELKLADRTAVYVDLLGKLQSAGMSGARPMAGHPPIAQTSPRTGKQPEPNANRADGIEFETPSGWQAGAKDAFSQVALETGTGSEKIRTTFSALSAAASDLTSNINRWRAQVGLPPQEAEAIQSEVTPMDIGGSSGNYVELVGPEEAILGAIVVHDDKAWFLKMRGPKAAAQAQRDKFGELLKSIRFD
jgi:hypothetical protein